MKSFFVFVAVLLLVWFLMNIRSRALNRVEAGQKVLAAERAKALSEQSEQAEVEKISAPAPAAPKPAADAIDTSPIHFLSISPEGAGVPVAGPLSFHARGPIRLVLQISLDAVAEDMPNPAQRPDQPARADLRIANTSFEVTVARDPAAKPVPFRASCSLSPVASDLYVDIEIGGNHDAMDAESKRIYAQELAGAVDQETARGQLAALHDTYRANTKGLYNVRALYRNGRMVSAPITLEITD
jgi:hypothetical protein